MPIKPPHSLTSLPARPRQRELGQTMVELLVVLVIVAMVSLPLVAAVFDGEGSENLIVPVQLVLMAGLGALAGCLLARRAAGDEAMAPAPTLEATPG